MRARIIAIAAGVVGSVAAAVLARRLLRRAKRVEEAKAVCEEPFEGVLLVEDILDLGEIYDFEEAVTAAPGPTPVFEDRAQAHGENWVEALQEQVIEEGFDPDAVLVFIDESEPEPPTETSERPVADRGSAGPRGA
jgi:hypothetical protein